MPAFPFENATPSEDRELIKEALAGAQGTVGFRTRAALNDAPELRQKTSLAVARAKEGDVEALRFLYVSYSHNIYGYVRSIVRDDHEAEDVTQHVFAKLMTTIDKYDDRGVPFFAWLLRLARNVAIDHLRANRVTPTETVLEPTAAAVLDLDRRDTVRDRAGRAAGRAARSRRSASRRRADPGGDRRPHGPDGVVDPRAASPRPASLQRELSLLDSTPSRGRRRINGSPRNGANRRGAVPSLDERKRRRQALQEVMEGKSDDRPMLGRLPFGDT